MTSEYYDIEKLFVLLEEKLDPYENLPHITIKYRLTGSEFHFRTQRIFVLILVNSTAFDLMFTYDDLKNLDSVSEQLQEIVTFIENQKPMAILNDDALLLTKTIKTLILKNNEMPYDLIKLRDRLNR